MAPPLSPCQGGARYNPSMAHDAARILERFAATAAEARDALSRAGVPRWELYAKASEWEETTLRPGAGETTVRCRETGLAVRTRRAGRSGFAAASGGDPAVWRSTVQTALATERPEAIDPLPPVEALGVAPAPPPGDDPPDGWGRELLTGLERGVRELSGGELRLTRGSVRSGRTGWLLHTAEGFTATHRSPACLLVVAISPTRAGVPGWRRVIPVRDPTSLDPSALARRLVNPFGLLRDVRARRAGITDILLDPAVAAHLLAGVVPLLLEPRETPPVGARIGSSLLELEDDRTGEAGPLVAPCDGEGVPARTTPLVREGVLVARLACCRDALRAGEAARAGGAVRPTYREPPVTGIANLFLRPRDGLPGESLVEAAGSAVYLLELAGPPEVDLAADRYRLAGLGVALEHGRVGAWHPLVEVTGRVSRLLGRLEATGARIAWHQTAAGVIGTPPLLFRAQLVG